MKIAVINFHGGVGKSTVSRHLLLPRLKNARLIAVESINTGAGADETYRGDEYREIMRDFLSHDHVVLDVGASNIESFLNEMNRFEGSHENINFFVVPAGPNTKVQLDTMSTLKELANIGVPSHKVRLLMNMKPRSKEVEQVFYPLINYHAAFNNFVLNKEAAIDDCPEVFQFLLQSKKELLELVEDQTDYMRLMNAAESTEDKDRYYELLSMKQLAGRVQKNLDAVFTALFK